MSEVLPKTVTDKYKVEWKVGEGTYGVVYKAVHKKTKAIVAIKKFKESASKEGGEGISLTACREIMVIIVVFYVELSIFNNFFMKISY